MPLLVNLNHLETEDLRLKGELPVKELELDAHDEMIRAEQPLEYEFEIQKLDSDLLLQGRLHLSLRCQCVRCLKPFTYELALEDWTRHLPLEGEEKIEIANDLADLTPYLREDILLEFPQHPLCEAGCRGLPKTNPGKTKKAGDPGPVDPESSAWTELDKLKF